MSSSQHNFSKKNMKFSASLFFFSIVLLGAHASLDKSIRGNTKMSKGGKEDKTNICHYDEDEGTFKTISISDNALDAHKNHGDFVCDGLDNIVGCDAMYGCVCVEGYEFKGEDGCVDIDECATETDNCVANSSCTNTPGSFECACNTGYRRGHNVIFSKPTFVEYVNECIDYHYCFIRRYGWIEQPQFCQNGVDGSYCYQPFLEFLRQTENACMSYYGRDNCYYSPSGFFTSDLESDPFAWNVLDTTCGSKGDVVKGCSVVGNFICVG